ncbi:hypothetical protein VTN77DRAFT_2072 [Rasamsonia byssochlamydoides]|uniref:uncharacterized protein n=1 Tax=Rasamsonia byssochlamydoides TaxID=89139 RepID=UPI003742B788
MSTISSPRPSITSSRARSPTPSSSRRPSVDTLNANVSGLGITRATSPAHRRNRAALRDYYNLKPAGADGSEIGTLRSASVPRSSGVGELYSPSTVPVNTELDNPDFDPQRYVDQLLATSSLATVLKAENTLVGDIRTLDGERKALVYDNYSKLIRAVETIGTMRRTMEERGAPLTMTKTLGPAVGFVAETAGALIREGEEQSRRVQEAKSAGADGKTAERETVKWVLGTPDRLRNFLSQQKREEAEKDWAEVEKLLSRWEGVKGVAELRAACEEIMKQEGV